MITLITDQGINRTLITSLEKPVSETFHQGIEIKYDLKLGPESWNSARLQYDADRILDILEKPLLGNRNLAILDMDIFAFGLNYVFGEADSTTRKGLISLTRLRPEYYNLSPQENLLQERTLKEVIHELGHTYSLRHCPNVRCVMHFSNSIRDTDIKGWQFCPICQRRLSLNL